MTRERRLGRGLAALLGAVDEAGGAPAETAEDGGEPIRRPDLRIAAADIAQDDQGPGELLQLNVYDIDDNPFQPRREFHEAEIASLAESLKAHDLLQPILVRRIDDRYQLISGERRLRAAIQAGWTSIPARLREADDRLVAELAIIENLQRKDLNAIEKALSFRRYLNEHSCTQEELAGRLKIDRATVSNLLRLLELPQPVQDAIGDSSISAGHARALLPLGDHGEQTDFCVRIKKEGISVRETERLVREKVDAMEAAELSSATAAARRKRRTQSEQVSALEKELRMALGTKVDIRTGRGGRGRIVVHFSSHDEFDRLHEILIDGGGIDVKAAG